MSTARAIVEARPRFARPRLKFTAGRDAALLSIGTLASGILAWVFNVVAARSLGPEAYGSVAALWAGSVLALLALAALLRLILSA